MSEHPYQESQKTNTIIINATAAKYGGALTILTEYLSEIQKSDKKSTYYIFCGVDLDEFECQNLKIIRIKTHGFGAGAIKRVFWDAFGLYIYCLRQKIQPDLIISFQNTGVFFRHVKQLIYYHQPIPLTNFKWKFYRNDERSLFIYRVLYPIFVRLMYNRQTEFVVQQHCLKKKFSDKFHIAKEKIHVISPNVNLDHKSRIEKLNLDQDKFHIFYPTNDAKYKNYDILFDAIDRIKHSDGDIYDKLVLHITLNRDINEIRRKTEISQIADKIHFLGKISYNDVIAYYNSVNLLVFPSYIETFGLPLIEAASFGLSIIVSDLEYAHETLGNYAGARYVQFNDSEKWAESIVDCVKTKPELHSFDGKLKDSSWGRFLELSNLLIQK